ncbi:MAG: HlyD family efflux transporter periplasmic adaptor subunit [Myxococcota bacterium]
MAAAGVLVAGLWSLGDALPRVDRQQVLTATVERGPLVREVRAPGRLVPTNIRWLTTLHAGRVEQIAVEAGQEVEAGESLIQLINLDVDLAAVRARSDIDDARARRLELQAQTRTAISNQRAKVVGLETALRKVQRTASLDQDLLAAGAVGAEQAINNRDDAHDVQARLKIERAHLQMQRQSARARVDAQARKVEGLKTVAEYRERLRAALNVTAPVAGVLQEVAIEPGQWVQPGAVLAKIVEPGRLDARLEVPEARAREVAVGQAVQVDMRGTVVAGHVLRIDPNVTNGNVVVDVRLDDPLPEGARPDQTVTGTITIETRDDVLQVRRPAQAVANSSSTMFRLTEDPARAHRVAIEFGTSSIDRIEILSGVQPGQTLVVSDMSKWDAHDDIRIQ